MYPKTNSTMTHAFKLVVMSDYDEYHYHKSIIESSMKCGISYEATREMIASDMLESVSGYCDSVSACKKDQVVRSFMPIVHTAIDFQRIAEAVMDDSYPAPDGVRLQKEDIEEGFNDLATKEMYIQFHCHPGFSLRYGKEAASLRKKGWSAERATCFLSAILEDEIRDRFSECTDELNGKLRGVICLMPRAIDFRSVISELVNEVYAEHGGPCGTISEMETVQGGKDSSDISE